MQKSLAKFYNKIAKEYVQQNWYNEHLSIPSLEFFSKILPIHSKILDVGCGGWQDSKFLTDNDFTVHGIDISKEMIKLAKKYAPKANFTITDVIELPSTKKYNWIRCCRVFHHISINEQDIFLKKLNTLLKKDGILYITSVVSDKRENYEMLDARDNKIVKKRLTAKSFKNLLIQYNFEILKFKYWIGKKWMEIFAKKC